MSAASIRAAVVGAGIVCPVGIGMDAFSDALRSGRHGVSRLDAFAMPPGKAGAAMVTDPAFAGADRACRMAVAAAREALAGATWDRSTMAVLISTIAGDSRAAELHFEEMAGDRPPSAGLAGAVRLYPNGAVAHAVGDAVAAGGPRLVITNACASGNIAAGVALDMLAAGHCDAALVVGVEILKQSMVWGAERSGFIGRSLRPFHRDRDGSILGEGAAAIVLRRDDSADPGAILGWIEGFGCACDRGATAITLPPDGSGLRRSMALALAGAGRKASEVEYVNAHAPGTPLIDRAECRAVSDLCGTNGETVAINATKSITGHLGGASAVAELIATLLQMRDGFLHPNVGLTDPDPDLALAPLGTEPVSRKVTRALSNACGGGGVNTSIALTAPEEPPSGQTSARDADAVVITGIGCICRLGAGARACFAADAGSVAPHGGDDLAWLDIDRFYPAEANYSYMNRAAQLAAAAGAMALEQARLDTYAPERIAVVSGTMLGGSPQASAVLCRALARRPESIRPSMALDHGIHLGATLVMRHYGFTGLTCTLSGMRTAGLMALMVAADLLRARRADAVVVLGFDAVDDLVLRGRRVLAPHSHRALSGGAGAVVLERARLARARGAGCLARVGGSRFWGGQITDAAQWSRVAAGVATSLGNGYGVLYADACDPVGSARLAAALAGGRGEVTTRHLQERTGYCLAADALLAVVAAVARGDDAVVASFEPEGALGAMRIDARESRG